MADNRRTDDTPAGRTGEGDEWTRFRELLESEYTFPARYLFKFIVPKDHVSSVEELFEASDLKIRASRRGNFLSVTANYHAESAQTVIDIYTSASEIPGVISL